MISNIRFLINLYRNQRCESCGKPIPAGSHYVSFHSDHMPDPVLFCHNNYGCIPGSARETVFADPLYKALTKYDDNEVYALGSLPTSNKFPIRNEYAKNCLICHTLVAQYATAWHWRGYGICHAACKPAAPPSIIRPAPVLDNDNFWEGYNK